MGRLGPDRFLVARGTGAPHEDSFLGGTGIISSACSELVLARGHELTLLNRSQSRRPPPPGARILNADLRDEAAVAAALGREEFDVVVDWIAYTPTHIEADLRLFRGRTGQFVFISSASAYQKPIGHLPITESTPLVNPFWEYSRQKIACEERLMRAAREEAFPVTIVRPSHTYDRTLIPFEGGWTVVERWREGRETIIHGDGTTRWVLTHHADFAKGFVGLLGHPQAIGDTFHITSDEGLTWNQIAEILATAAGTTARTVHLSSEIIAAHDPGWGAGLLGDKAHSVQFDNAKIRRLVPDFVCTTPFHVGAREIVSWHDADPARRVRDAKFEAMTERLVDAYRGLLPAGCGGR